MEGPRPLDFVWIVDNSSSMQDEAPRVAANLSAFARRLPGMPLAKMVLVSMAEYPSVPWGSAASYVAMRVPADQVQAFQLDTPVGSHNSFAMMLSAFCDPARAAWRALSPKPESDPGFANLPGSLVMTGNLARPDDAFQQKRKALWWNGYPKSFCGAPAGSASGDDDFDPIVQGTLARRTRVDVAKVLVFVTDEADKMVAPAAFLARFKDMMGGTPFTVAPFVKQGASADGAPYRELAALMGLPSYDIDASDWSASFDSLIQRGQEAARAHFKLADAKARKILAVRIDGVGADASKFTLKDDYVDAALGTLATGAKRVDLDLELAP